MPASMNGVRTQCLPRTELISARMPLSRVTQSESGAGITVTALLDVPVVVSLPARRNSTRERLPVVIWSSGQRGVPTEMSNELPALASCRDVAADRHHDPLRREPAGTVRTDLGSQRQCKKSSDRAAGAAATANGVGPFCDLLFSRY